VTIADVVDAKKIKMDPDAAWALLKDAGRIDIAKGKKVQTFTALKGAREEVLKQAMGPSGNLRAPTFRVKDRFVIGFNADLYAEWVK